MDANTDDAVFLIFSVLTVFLSFFILWTFHAG